MFYLKKNFFGTSSGVLRYLEILFNMHLGAYHLSWSLVGSEENTNISNPQGDFIKNWEQPQLIKEKKNLCKTSNPHATLNPQNDRER